jgi:methionyl-tRNA formyltransferase
MRSSLEITIVSDAGSWKNDFLPSLIDTFKTDGHQTTWVHGIPEIPQGNLLFCLGFTRILPPGALRKHEHNLIVHESPLPQGRGWSPVSWQILEGAKEIPLTLFEAVEKVDAGRIYLRDRVKFQGTELINEIRAAAIRKAIELCIRFVREYPDILSRGAEQRGTPSYYRRRGAEDSRLDPNKTIREQFNLFRIADNDLYPVFFTIDGRTYNLKIEERTEPVSHSHRS